MARPKGSKTQNRKGNSPAHRFTLTEDAALKARIQQLDAMGYNTVEIAREVNVSRPTVSSRLKEIQQDYQDAYIDNRKMWTMRELATLMDVRRRAYEEIAALKERGKRKTVTKSGENDKGGYCETAETKEDPELLGWHNLVRQTVQDTAELLGLKELPAQVFNIVQNNNTVNVFDQLLAAMLAQDPPAPAVTGPVIDASEPVTIPPPFPPSAPPG